MRIDAAGPAPGRGQAGLEAAAQAFESIFSQMLLKSMRATVQQSPMFHGGRGEEVFGDLLDRKFAESGARGGGLGIARMIVERYRRNVEAAEAR